jgi:hypothetical protein
MIKLEQWIRSSLENLIIDGIIFVLIVLLLFALLPHIRILVLF